MAKLQRIKRSNGSVSYSVNIPLEIIEKIGWKKGDELEISETKNINVYILSVSRIEDIMEVNDGTD